MSILGRETKIPKTIEQEHVALRGCISRFISSHITGILALILQQTIHSDHSFILSLWLCSDKVCPHATDFRLRVTCTILISRKLSNAGWPNSAHCD